MNRHPLIAWLLERCSRAWVVPAAARRQHTAVVHDRVRALAPIIALVTLAWIPIDALGLSGTDLAAVAAIRVLLAAGLLALALYGDTIPAFATATMFLGWQAACFLVIQGWLGQNEVAPRLGYGLFPFVLASQLAVLPWPWGRSLCLAAVAVVLLVVDRHLPVAEWTTPVLNDLWLFAVIVAFAVWASQVQLTLLVDLLGAREDARHDGLTRIPNRRLAEDRLLSEHARALRQNEPLSLLMLDLDHFKHVNDRYGHAAGDRVLQATADALQHELRRADLGARFGGEEFLAILPATDGTAALQIAERLRQRIASLRVTTDDRRDTVIRVTVSIGVATLSPSESVASLLARTDAALYRAKNKGRNRCETAPASGEMTPFDARKEAAV